MTFLAWLAGKGDKTWGLVYTPNRDFGLVISHAPYLGKLGKDFFPISTLGRLSFEKSHWPFTLGHLAIETADGKTIDTIALPRGRESQLLLKRFLEEYAVLHK